MGILHWVQREVIFLKDFLKSQWAKDPLVFGGILAIIAVLAILTEILLRHA
jgi:hypothetical protein